MQCSSVQCSAVQFSLDKWRAVQCSCAVQWGAVQWCEGLCSAECCSSAGASIIISCVHFHWRVKQSTRFRAAQHIVLQCNSIKCHAVLCSSVQCISLQCIAVHCSAVQCKVGQCCYVQCSAVQRRAVQWSALQCRAVSKMQYRSSPHHNLVQTFLPKNTESTFRIQFGKNIVVTGKLSFVTQKVQGD